MTDVPAHLQRYRDLLDDFDAFAEALRRPLPQTVAINPLRIEPARFLELAAGTLAATPVPWYPGAFRLAAEDRPGRFWGFPAGLFTVQEEASLLPVRMLDVRPGHRVLDLCAAPGNKTAQIALAMGNRGTLVANDISGGRLSALFDTSRRLGLVNIATSNLDGTRYPAADGQFDRILLDAPCTAEGNARRGIMRDSSAEFRRWVRSRQRALLRRAIDLCAPGGRIVYATCTFDPEENEAVVADVLADCGEAVRIVPAAPMVTGASPGVTRWQGSVFPEALQHAVRLWPHRTDTGGFFAVALERAGEPGGGAGPDVLDDLPPASGGDELRACTEPFDVPADDLAGLHCFHATKLVRLVADDLRPPAGVPLLNLGLDLSHRRSARPRVTTAAAMALCQRAGRGRVRLADADFERWRCREDVFPDLPGTDLDAGTVLVDHAGFVTGTAQARPAADGTLRLESHFPKAWMRPRST